jgi:hypothetical protein
VTRAEFEALSDHELADLVQALMLVLAARRTPYDPGGILYGNEAPEVVAERLGVKP